MKTIHMRKTSNGTKRAMGALTMTAAGNFLTPMIIFKGKPNGNIVTVELKNFNPTSVYTCQDAARMDEGCMHMWVEEIFTPYHLANLSPPCIQPVILLDAYLCHMMRLVVSKIAALGVEVIYIPGGCTSLCQPLNVGTNKLFKHCCHHLWEDWMINMIDTNSEIREVTQEEGQLRW
jgi:hypothetical protein